MMRDHEGFSGDNPRRVASGDQGLIFARLRFGNADYAAFTSIRMRFSPRIRAARCQKH
jgi:hypothetical protein